MKLFKSLIKENNQKECLNEDKEEDSSSIKDAKIIVLGACCSKSTQSFENVKQAVIELELNDEVVNIGDHSKIASFGVMSTPALVVDGNVVSYGRKLSVEDAKAMIRKARSS